VALTCLARDLYGHRIRGIGRQRYLHSWRINMKTHCDETARLLAIELISRCSRSLSFLDAKGPPRVVCGRADEIAALLQGDTSAGLCIFQLIEISEMAVDQDSIGQGPKVLSGLELGRGGGKEE
jgi:hypothetical protein